jgi:hypothetical protein
MSNVPLLARLLGQQFLSLPAKRKQKTQGKTMQVVTQETEEKLVLEKKKNQF